MSNNYCLVVMPNSDSQQTPQLSQRLNQLYTIGIKPVVEENERLPIKRVTVGMEHVHEIVEQIGGAHFIIIVCEGQDPDLSYLIGVCHALALPMIPIYTSRHDIPILLRSYPKIILNLSSMSDELERFREELLSYVSSDSNHFPKSPVQQYFPYDKRPVPNHEYVELESKKRQCDNQIRELQDKLRQIELASEQTQTLIKEYPQKIHEYQKLKKYLDTLEGISGERRIEFRPASDRNDLAERNGQNNHSEEDEK